MPTVQDYLDVQKEVQNNVQTLQRRVRQAYDKAQEELNEGDSDRLDKLIDKSVGEKFVNTLIAELFNSPLHQKVLKALSKEEDQSEMEKILLFGTYGFTRDHISALIQAAKENLTYEGYMKYLNDPKQTDFEKIIGREAQPAYRLLDEVPAEDVLKYVGREVKDPSRVTLEDKIKLLEQNEKEKTRPYMN